MSMMFRFSSIPDIGNIASDVFDAVCNQGAVDPEKFFPLLRCLRPDFPPRGDCSAPIVVDKTASDGEVIFRHEEAVSGKECRVFNRQEMFTKARACIETEMVEFFIQTIEIE